MGWNYPNYPHSVGNLCQDMYVEISHRPVRNQYETAPIGKTHTNQYSLMSD